MVMITPENLPKGQMQGKQARVYKRWKSLENDRASWRSHWIEISDYLLPRRGKYLLESSNSRGQKHSGVISQEKRREGERGRGETLSREGGVC